MANLLDDMLARRPVDRAAIDEHKRWMLQEIRAYQLRDLREAVGMTQVQLADALDVSQNRVSRLEHGDIERTQVDTLRRYVEAVGGQLRLEVEIGNRRIPIG
jgi:predicted XRE-type DNA-binding protein